MKRSAITGLTILAVINCLGQGTVNFANIQGALNEPIFSCDGTRLLGPNFKAGLLAGTTANTLGWIAETTFLTGAGAGYFSGGAKTLPGIPGGSTAWIQIVAWDSTLGGTTTGATFAQARTTGQAFWGESSVFAVVTGDPQASPPTVPAALYGLKSFTVSGAGSGFASFTFQPTNQTVVAGSTARFSVGAVACPAPSYQWYFNGASLPGATKATYEVFNVQQVSAGDYWVVLSNPDWGSVTSVKATLTVTTASTPPAITAQPQGQSVGVGGTASFEVGATGSPPLLYQWFFNGTSILGATNSKLTLTNIQPNQAGFYSVMVRNDRDAVVSSSAELKVSTRSATVQITANAIGPDGQFSLPIVLIANGDENALGFSLNFPTDLLKFVSVTLAETNSNATLALNTNRAAFGELGMGIALPPGATFSAGTREIARVVLRASAVSFAALAEITFGDEPTTRQVSDPFAQRLAANFIGTSVSIPAFGTVVFANLYLASGVNAPVVSCNGAKLPGPDYRAGLFGGKTATSLWLLDETPLVAGVGAGYFNGGVVGIPGVAGGGTGWVQVVVWDTTLGGTTNGATFDQARAYGESVWGESSLFSVVTGNTSASPPELPAALKGLDSINVGGTTPHFAAFVSQPTNQTVRAGDAASFFVSAVACPVPDYQWYFNGAVIPGATDDHLSATNVQPGDAGNFHVVLSNPSWGSRVSAIATLRVTGEFPIITVEPQGQTAPIGGDAEFSVSAVGNPTPRYQWSFNSSTIPGATNSTLRLTGVQISQAGIYTVVVTNEFGSAISSPALLTVAPLVITSQPQSQTVLPGAAADFAVSVIGTSPMAYQWLFNDRGIQGATGPTLHLDAVQVSQSGTYAVAVSNAFGGVRSAAAGLTVEEVRIVDQTANFGSNVTFTAQVIGYPGLSYAWFWSGTNQPISTSVNPFLLLTNIQLSQAGVYTVVATTAIGSVTSAPAMLVVNPLVILTQPQSQLVLTGAAADFSVGVVGAPPVGYQWFFNSNAIAGANGSTLHLDNIQPNQTGAYQVVATNLFASVTSSPALLSLGGVQVSSQTAEIGSGVRFNAEMIGYTGLSYTWFWNGTTQVGPSVVEPRLLLTNVAVARTGTYTVVAVTPVGSVTSAPATLNVILPVPRKPAPVLLLSGQAGMSLNLEVADTIDSPPDWRPFASVALTNDFQWYFDFSLPVPDRRFYRAFDAGTPGRELPLEIGTIPALTLEGAIGSRVRVDGIDRFGPTDAWFTVETVTLTNSSQVYFDVSALGQPPRLYRLVPIP
jgi:hypothetical protein